MNAHTHGKKWVVGLDLRPTGQGALRFATWLAEALGAQGERFVGLHVLEEAHLRAALRYHHLDELIDSAREVASELIKQAQATEVLPHVDVVEGVHAEKTLEAARVYHHAHGIIVGRQAPREGQHLLRLGKVARRLLRTLDAPVIVVPPDYEATNTRADGPVVCTTNVGDEGVQAARFAADTAARLGRRLVLLYVVPTPDEHGMQYLPPATRAKIANEHQSEGERELEQWVEEHGIVAADHVVERGHVIEILRRYAREQDAILLVAGSRRLSSLERLLLTSVGSELAATASCPVAVVPPTPSAG